MVLAPVVDSAGLTSAGHSFGVPGIVNFNGVSYNTPTGGTLPMVLNKTKTHGFNTASGSFGASWEGGIISSRIEIQGRHPQPSGFNTNYTLRQQGFTANVSCHERDLSTFPSFTRSLTDQRVPIPTSSKGYITGKWWDWKAKCPNNSASLSKSGSLHSFLDQCLNYFSSVCGP